MSHNITARDIQIGKTLAWHRLTTLREKISLDNVEIRYPMKTVPLFIETEAGRFETDFKQIISTDDNRPIGKPVGSKYSLLSNDQLCEMTSEALKGFDHEIVSVGTVANRSLAFVSVSLKENAVIQAAGRKTMNVLNIMWGHGGNMPVIAKSGFTVVVCNNTFDMAMAESSDFKFRLKHCLNASDKLEGMSEAIDKHYGIVGEFKQAMDSLHNEPCDVERAGIITTGILADGKEISTRAANSSARIVELFMTGAGNEGATMADLFNGFTDYYSHESAGGKNEWKQYVSSEFGAAGNAKREVYDILTNAERVADVTRKGNASLALALN